MFTVLAVCRETYLSVYAIKAEILSLQPGHLKEQLVDENITIYLTVSQDIRETCTAA